MDQVALLAGFFTYLAIAGSIIPGKRVPGIILSDGTRLHYNCNGQFTMYSLVHRNVVLFISCLNIYTHVYLHFRSALASTVGCTSWDQCQDGFYISYGMCSTFFFYDIFFLLLLLL